jgi:hypothetical protein
MHGGTGRVKPVLEEDLWRLIEPLLPNAQVSSQAPSGAQASGRPGGVDEHRVCTQDGQPA